MPWIVDGDNLLGRARRARTDDVEKRRLSAELDRFARAAGKRVTVWFDGDPPDRSGFSGHVRFSGRGRSADDGIHDQVRRSANPGGCVVVTSDRSLADRCRWLGARPMSCEEFRRRLARAAAATGGGEKPDRETDVDGWLEVFGEIDG